MECQIETTLLLFQSAHRVCNALKNNFNHACTKKKSIGSDHSNQEERHTAARNGLPTESNSSPLEIRTQSMLCIKISFKKVLDKLIHHLIDNRSLTLN